MCVRVCLRLRLFVLVSALTICMKKEQMTGNIYLEEPLKSVHCQVLHDMEQRPTTESMAAMATALGQHIVVFNLNNGEVKWQSELGQADKSLTLNVGYCQDKVTLHRHYLQQ